VRLAVAFIGLLALAAIVAGELLPNHPHASAAECSRNSLRGNLISAGSEAELSIRGLSYKCQPRYINVRDFPLDLPIHTRYCATLTVNKAPERYAQ
jgi:hypothetical protein